MMMVVTGLLIFAGSFGVRGGSFVGLFEVSWPGRTAGGAPDEGHGWAHDGIDTGVKTARRWHCLLVSIDDFVHHLVIGGRKRSEKKCICLL